VEGGKRESAERERRAGAQSEIQLNSHGFIISLQRPFSSYATSLEHRRSANIEPARTTTFTQGSGEKCPLKLARSFDTTHLPSLGPRVLRRREFAQHRSALPCELSPKFSLEISLLSISHLQTSSFLSQTSKIDQTKKNNKAEAR
jgi:hypothetical protein